MVQMCGWEWAFLSGYQWEVTEFKGRGCSCLSWKQLLCSLPWRCYTSLPNGERLLVSQQINSKVLSQYSWSSTLCLQLALLSKPKPDFALFFNSTSLSLSWGSFLNIASLFSISTCWNSIHTSSVNSRTCSFTGPFLLYRARLRFILSVWYLSRICCKCLYVIWSHTYV